MSCCRWRCLLALCLTASWALALDVVTVDAPLQSTAYEQDTQPASFTVTRSGRTGPLTVQLQFASGTGTATIGSDFQIAIAGLVQTPSASSTVAVVFADGESSKTVDVQPIDDADAEGAEAVRVSLVTLPAVYTNGIPSSAEITIGDNDVILNLVTKRPMARETAVSTPPMDTAEVDLVWRKPDGTAFVPTSPFSVTIQVLSSSTANLNSDYYVAYRPSTFRGTFRATGWNNTTKTLTVSGIPDDLGIGASIWLMNDTAPRVVTSATAAGMSQWDLTLDASITSQSSLPGEVFYAMPSSLPPDTSFQLPTRIPASATDLEMWFLPRQDVLAEGHETVSLTVLSSPSFLLTTPTSATVTIADDDLVVGIRTLSHASEAAPTASGSAIIEIFDVSNHPLPAPQDLAISFRTPFAAGSATSAGTSPDFAIATSSAVSFSTATSAGAVRIAQGSTAAVVALYPFADSDNSEGTETVTIKLIDGPDYILLPSPGSGADTSATINILDCQGLLSVAADTSAEIPESPAATASFIVTLARTDTSAAIAVPFSVAGASAGDYWLTPAAGNVTIPIGSTTAAVMFSPRADLEIEPTETVVLTVTPPTQVMLNPQGSATAALAIRDTTPRVALSATPAAIRETGSETATITATLYNPPAGISASAPFMVLYAIGGTSSATAADVAFSAASLVFTDLTPAGTATTVLAVTAQADALAETSELLVVAAQASATCAVAASEGTATITITDSTPQVVITAVRDAVEGGQTGLAVVSCIANQPTDDLVVAFAVSGGSAAAGDYTLSHAGSVTLPRGGSATIAVTAIEDRTMEGSETVVITLAGSATSGYAVATPSATVTIRELVPAVALRLKQDAVEGGQVGMVEAYLADGVAVARDLVLTCTASGSATVADYSLSASTITIAAGTLSGTLSVTAVEDNAAEAPETLTIALGAAVDGSYALAASSSATVTLTDYKPQVGITATRMAAEGGFSGECTVSYAPRPALPTALTVGISLSGTATLGLDYLPSTGATTMAVTIPANATSATITIGVIDDALVEGSETVVVALLAAQDGSYQVTAGQGSATVLISDRASNKPTAPISLAGGGGGGGCGLGSGLGLLLGAAGAGLALRRRRRS